MQRISLEINPKFSTKISLKSVSKFIDDDKVNFYIEDKNKANYYKTLFSTIYPKCSNKIRIIDTNRGKENVIKSYVDNENKNLKGRNFYILDKDFDDKYPCNHPNFKIDNFFYNYKLLKKNDKFLVWERYCIENYFLNFSLIVCVLNQLTCISNLKFKFFIRKIFKYANLLSKYQLKNQLADSKNKLNYNSFIEFKTLNIDILKLVKELRVISKKHKNSNFYSVKYSYNIIKDINGKRFFKLFHSWCIKTSTLKINIAYDNFMNLFLSAYLQKNKSNNFRKFSRELDKIFNNI
ncbi:hypothetical protein I6H56_01065 [Fusobacterium canifelinum]|uniref:DUF4435 domain-containing protein n=1 Tax=Fusobacterium canifelinum TaxID=285729 RepID=A0A7T4KHG6_9FUSO|nr:hypothetical protein [Fusobacterium canifelinum]QQB74095.1 hypothetical protein I6H56_01065 [Fusobacterium canifelinum]